MTAGVGLGWAASPASAVLVHLPGGRSASYQPLLGAAKAAPLDSVFTNVDYNGGPVMPSNANYTVYWDPSGAPSYPSGYKAGVDQFFTDLAHDSGGVGNVDSVAAQYNDAAGDYASYVSSFAGRLDDGDAYPASGCAGATICLTDAQIQSELSSYISSQGLPRDLTHEYFLLLPPGVETCFDATGAQGCSAGSSVNPKFCAYHSNSSIGQEFIYADDPYVTGISGCDDGNHPNGSPSDGVIEGGLVHEHDESITDPEPNDAWADASAGGSEIGDKCEGVMGTSSGTAPNGAKYNEVINGHLYWFQHEWSNQGHTCLGRLTFQGNRPVATFTSTPSGYLTIAFDASGSTADGGVSEYNWQWGDAGSPTSPPAGTETSSATIEHTFPGPGTYTVALTVFAADGTSTGTTRTITVSELPPAAPGWALSDFATGFDNTYLGPMGIVADQFDNLYVGDAPDGLLYKFGSQGGIAADNVLSPSAIGSWPLGLAFGKDGELYAVLNGDNEVVQVDPVTGDVVRVVADVGDPLGIATDPVSGDLFVTSDSDGGVDRISDPSSASPAVTQYATGMSVPDGISAAPDGTFYVEDNGNIDSVSASNSAAPGTVTPIANVSSADGVGVGANPFDPAAPTFVVANGNDGTMTQINLNQTPATTAPVFSGGTRGDFVTVAPDGCLYATQQATVLRVSDADGSCPFSPITPFQPPALQPVAPAAITPTSATFQATVNPQGTATTFHFQYGTGTGYGSTTPDLSAGSSDQPVTVSQTVTGLAPDTVYHYRVVAHNEAGTVYGSDSVLSTLSQVNVVPQGGTPAPTVLSLPTISGRAVPGQTLRCQAGTWTGATGYSFSWVRDARATSAQGSTYRIKQTDVGHRLACMVEAQGPGGTTPAESAAVTVKRIVRLFTIHVTAPTTSPAQLREAGARLAITVPRACSATIRLFLITPGHRVPTVRVLAVRQLRFTGRGTRTLTIAVPASALGRGIVRLAASAAGGGEQSRPASVTIYRGH
ncbi:MAG: PKD domain-containing protein [Solirubrobacterales bacterium]|nr:PKD domain-containing protein [Solirubrobacterales bacterium]